MANLEITLSFDENKHRALEFALSKENTTVRERLEQSLSQLYEQTVPEPVREYVESFNPPPAKPKRPVRSANKQQPKVEPTQAAPSAIALKNEEEQK